MVIEWLTRDGVVQAPGHPDEDRDGGLRASESGQGVPRLAAQRNSRSVHRVVGTYAVEWYGVASCETQRAARCSHEPPRGLIDHDEC